MGTATLQVLAPGELWMVSHQPGGHLQSGTCHAILERIGSDDWNPKLGTIYIYMCLIIFCYILHTTTLDLPRSMETGLAISPSNNWESIIPSESFNITCLKFQAHITSRSQPMHLLLAKLIHKSFIIVVHLQDILREPCSQNYAKVTRLAIYRAI